MLVQHCPAGCTALASALAALLYLLPGSWVVSYVVQAYVGVRTSPGIVMCAAGGSCKAPTGLSCLHQ